MGQEVALEKSICGDKEEWDFKRKIGRVAHENKGCTHMFFQRFFISFYAVIIYEVIYIQAMMEYLFLYFLEFICIL